MKLFVTHDSLWKAKIPLAISTTHILDNYLPYENIYYSAVLIRFVVKLDLLLSSRLGLSETTMDNN